MNLIKSLKGSKLYSILTGTCPVCQEDSMYKEPNPYKVARIFEMYERCTNCNTKYKMEPSFFFGAMYVSYGVGIAFATPAFVVPYWGFGVPLLLTFFIMVVTLIIFLPIIVRLSRNIWVNLFFKYDKTKAKRKEEHNSINSRAS